VTAFLLLATSVKFFYDAYNWVLFPQSKKWPR
jgi:hypothetical protein